MHNIYKLVLAMTSKEIGNYELGTAWACPIGQCCMTYNKFSSMSVGKY